MRLAGFERGFETQALDARGRLFSAGGGRGRGAAAIILAMRAIILAGGHGDKFQPLTKSMAKAAVPFLNRPLLHYALDLAASAGASEIAVAACPLSGSVNETLAAWDGPRLKIQLTREAAPLGTGGALGPLLPWLGGEDALVLESGLLVDCDPKHLPLASAAQRADGVLLSREQKDTFKEATLIADANGRIVQMAGQPPLAGLPPAPAKSCGGVHWFAPGIVRTVLKAGPSDLHSELIPALIRQGRKLVELPMKSPFWADPGDRKSYLGVTGAALKAMGENKWPFRAAAGCTLSRGFTGSLLYADATARLKPGLLRIDGFAVVGADCRIEQDVTLRNAVLMAGVRVAGGALIENSIVAPGGRVNPGESIRDAIKV